MQESADTIPTVAVVGAGRMGRAITAALRAAGVDVCGPLGRGATGAGADVVLLAVPDDAIAAASAAIATPSAASAAPSDALAAGPFVGHLSGATSLEPLAGHRAFSLHPLMNITPDVVAFDGIPAAVAGVDDEARSIALTLARLLGMTAFTVTESERIAYHAAACIASNYLLTLEALAERLAASAGVPRGVLIPLVRSTVENWARRGAMHSLTGPVSRGDEAVVSRQRDVVAQRTPDALDLFDILTEATRTLAAARQTPAAARHQPQAGPS